MAQFDTTNWSVVLKAGSGDTTGCREALSALCETYWYPVYAFVRRSGASAEDAEDLTQAYFARFLEKRFLDDVRPERGRFRSFLLVSVRNFLHNERDRERAQKRGGGQRPLPLHGEEGEVRYEREPVDAVTPEVLFERAWVRAGARPGPRRGWRRRASASCGASASPASDRSSPETDPRRPTPRSPASGGWGIGGAGGRAPAAPALRDGPPGRGGPHGGRPRRGGGGDPPSSRRRGTVTGRRHFFLGLTGDHAPGTLSPDPVPALRRGPDRASPAGLCARCLLSLGLTSFLARGRRRRASRRAGRRGCGRRGTSRTRSAARRRSG